MSEIAEREATNSFAGARQPCDAAGPYWRWSFIALLIIATALRIYLAGRSGLRPDELFSLAMATGHSLEHPAAVADPKLGDFAEPNQAVPIRGISALSKT